MPDTDSDSAEPATGSSTSRAAMHRPHRYVATSVRQLGQFPGRYRIRSSRAGGAGQFAAFTRQAHVELLSDVGDAKDLQRFGGGSAGDTVAGGGNALAPGESGPRSQWRGDWRERNSLQTEHPARYAAPGYSPHPFPVIIFKDVIMKDSLDASLIRLIKNAKYFLFVEHGLSRTSKMTETVTDVVINLAATGIAFTAGVFFRRITFGFRTRALRAFWKPIVHGGVRVAIGNFVVDKSDVNSPSKNGKPFGDLAGHAGLGDINAYAEIRDQLQHIGVKNFPLGPGSEVTPDQRVGNLILLGGPHSNPVSAKILDQIPHTFSFGSVDTPGPLGKDTKIYDSELDMEFDCRIGPSQELLSDQGIIIRCANPYSPKRSVLILAGSWGFGTLAATRLIESRDFLKHPIVNSGDPFEAVISCEIVEGAVTKIRLEIIRRIATTPSR